MGVLEGFCWVLFYTEWLFGANEGLLTKCGVIASCKKYGLRGIATFGGGKKESPHDSAHLLWDGACCSYVRGDSGES
jgi:hypothetical protein